MAAIVCELCGSNDVVKQDGVFVCQHCGTKYTLEEARKLLGTVQVDKSQETEKLLLLARRARDDNNSENAEKYYGLVLQEEPDNWEAYFYQLYYSCMQTKIAYMSSSCLRIANALDTILTLIRKNTEEISGQQKAIIEITDRCLDYVTLVESAIIQHGKGYSDASAALKFVNEQSQGVIILLQKLGDVCKQFDLKTKAISVYKRAAGFCDRYSSKETEIINKIKELDPNYERPPLPPRSSGCYVATAVYGSYDCPQVWTLRRYRDYTLAETWYGRAFIHTYYAISPTLVKWFGDTEWFKNMWKPKLDKMVKGLNAKGVADTPYQDRNW